MNASDLIQKKHEYIFISRMNIAYHGREERMFISMTNFSTFFSIVLSSATIASFGNILPPAFSTYSKYLGFIFASTVTVLNALMLAFRIQTRANEHKDFRRKWYGILKEVDLVKIAEDGKNINECQTKLNNIFSEMSQVSAVEPPENKKRLLHAALETCKTLGLEYNNPSLFQKIYQEITTATHFKGVKSIV